MVTANTGSIALYALQRVQGVPVSVSGLPMENFCVQGINALQNWTGDSIGTTGIAEKYQPFLVEYTVARTLAYMHGVGVNFSLGALSVAGGGANPLIQASLDSMKMELQSVGRKIGVYKSFEG